MYIYLARDFATSWNPRNISQHLVPQNQTLMDSSVTSSSLDMTWLMYVSKLIGAFGEGLPHQVAEKMTVNLKKNMLVNSCLDLLSVEFSHRLFKQLHAVESNTIWTNDNQNLDATINDAIIQQ